MCLALPAKVIALNPDADEATVALEGVKKTVSLALVEEVALGDFLLIHVGYALNKLSRDDRDIPALALMAEAGLLEVAAE